MAMSGKLRYALVGCGGCGCGKHLESYRKHAGRVDIVALCDILPEKIERARRRFNLDVPGYTDYRAMLRKERLDLISVATPNAFHAPVAVAALRAGVHVHSEKPLSTSAAGAQKNGGRQKRVRQEADGGAQQPLHGTVAVP